ncbi:hypothetical protein PIROE2DRAFT_14687 [Piromyces sp. E2]|nr:hypothetical protein PIROE2DRAFT_14687 [Piromyces sp. E2]|eukprot:OUM59716.1 hypothetical protein PIROE2DRAFT_14687 [Piromyces sp. E2]
MNTPSEPNQEKQFLKIYLKCYNNSTNVIVGAVDENLNLTFSILASLSIVMSHYHLSKNNFIQDNFFYKIMGDEKGAILQFIKRVRLIDERIKYLISNYINNIDENSPIAELISKNKVTYNQNWIYTGIINKGKDHEYINCRYFKDPINKKFKIGTNVYSDEKYCREVADLLSRDTFCYIRGNIYPIVKVSYVIVNERTINGVPMVNFTCKAYFVDINFSSDSIYTSTERI